MVKKILVYAVFSLLFYSCASTVRYDRDYTEEIEYESTIKIEVEKTYCWINEMPGSEGRFNITGAVRVLESPGYDHKMVKLKNIKIIQNKKELYYIKPVVRKDENSGIIQFSTVKGLLPNSNMDVNKKVDVYFIFEEDEDKFTYLNKNCIVERVK